VSIARSTLTYQNPLVQVSAPSKTHTKAPEASDAASYPPEYHPFVSTRRVSGTSSRNASSQRRYRLCYAFHRRAETPRLCEASDCLPPITSISLVQSLVILPRRLPGAGSILSAAAHTPCARCISHLPADGRCISQGYSRSAGIRLRVVNTQQRTSCGVSHTLVIGRDVQERAQRVIDALVRLTAGRDNVI
jgi:hypothetical protein